MGHFEVLEFPQCPQSDANLNVKHGRRKIFQARILTRVKTVSEENVSHFPPRKRDASKNDVFPVQLEGEDGN